MSKQLTRGGFFGALVGAVGGAKAVAAQGLAKDEYNGYKIQWTGWKSSIGYLDLAGQWIAKDRDGKVVYVSSCPGATHKYFPGICFDISVQTEKQRLCYGGASKSEKDLEPARAEALMRLLDVINGSKTAY